MPGSVGRYAGAAGEFGVGSLSETPGPGCGVTEIGVMPWIVGRLATAGTGRGAATPGEPGRGAVTPGGPGTVGVEPDGYASKGSGCMPGTVGRSEAICTGAMPGTVGRSPGGTGAGGGPAMGA
jgi:hypothetical protein